MTTAIRAIINADDLGIDSKTNAAVFELMQVGHVTSATVLANGPAFDAAVSQQRQFAHLSFGIHLNVTQFAPLSKEPGLSPLLDQNGFFVFDRIQRARLTTRLLTSIANEFSLQILRLRQSGLPISHIDSHQHIHTLPKLWPVLKWLQYRHAIKRVRISRNLYPTQSPRSRELMAKKALWNFALRKILNTQTTNYFGDLFSFVDQKEGFQPATTVEIMVHPGNSHYAEETALLHTNWWQKLPFEITPITYDQL
ncbi:MAG: ChbG/HpnK family deacetylase [Pseudomonadota bacterium]